MSATISAVEALWNEVERLDVFGVILVVAFTSMALVTARRRSRGRR